MSSSVHIDNKRKDILILGKGATQGLSHKSYAENQYSINFSWPGIKFCLSVHYNGSKHLIVNATKIYQFKAKDSEIKIYLLGLEIFQKISQLTIWKKPALMDKSTNLLLIIILLILVILLIFINI